MDDDGFRLPADIADIVGRSYGRCVSSPDFLKRFFASLMEADPEIRAMFAGLDLPRQICALRGILATIIMHAAGRGPLPHRLEELRRQHGPSGLGLQRRHFDIWSEQLLEALAKTDPRFSDRLRSAWTMVLEYSAELVIGVPSEGEGATSGAQPQSSRRSG